MVCYIETDQIIDIPDGLMDISQIAPILNEEIILFENKIEEYNSTNQKICEEIVEKISKIVETLFPDLQVKSIYY